MVRVISISDEVYLELSRIKNGRSFTQLIKSLLNQCQNKGDPQKILDFIRTHEPLSDEDAKKMISDIEEGRRRATQRNISFE